MDNRLSRRLKRFVKSIVPLAILRFYHEFRTHHRRSDGNRPVQEVFCRIYRENAWGGRTGELYSGTGSADPSVDLYAGIVRDFIQSRRINQVIDLGCGDFRVGSRIQIPGVRYVGVDIVPDVIRHNQVKYGGGDVSFVCCDIIRDNLPDGQLGLVRQVLQHLSNEEIAAILANAQKYRYLIVTEHHPAPGRPVVPNRDKPHGQGTRVVYDSGVFLDQPPFNKKISRVLLETDIASSVLYERERMVTVLIENASPG